MSKSMLTIEKEIQKDLYRNSPLGKLEKKIGKFYQEMSSKKNKLPESISKKIFDIRDANEKAQMDYIAESQKRDREKVDEILFESMSKEWELIEGYLATNQNTTENV